MSYLVAGQHFPGREAASALEGRCHRSPGQATPKAERHPGYSAYCARVPRPLWPQSAQLTGAKEAMELTYIPGVDVGDMSVRPFSMGDRLPGKRFFRLPLLAKATVAGNLNTFSDTPGL